MELTIFGAAGRTGRAVVAQAIERGHAVTAFVRSAPGGDAFAGAERVVTGDARNQSAVASAVRGAEAVVSAMGPGGPDGGTVYSDAIGVLVREMDADGPRRVVISANSRVLDDEPLSGGYAAVSQEHRNALATLRVSGLAWTVVATPMLTDAPPIDAYDLAVGARSRFDRIARADLAQAMLDALDHDDWIGTIVDVTTEG